MNCAKKLMILFSLFVIAACGDEEASADQEGPTAACELEGTWSVTYQGADSCSLEDESLWIGRNERGELKILYIFFPEFASTFFALTYDPEACTLDYEATIDWNLDEEPHSEKRVLTLVAEGKRAEGTLVREASECGDLESREYAVVATKR